MGSGLQPELHLRAGGAVRAGGWQLHLLPGLHGALLHPALPPRHLGGPVQGNLQLHRGDTDRVYYVLKTKLMTLVPCFAKNYIS